MIAAALVLAGLVGVLIGYIWGALHESLWWTERLKDLVQRENERSR